MSSEKPQEKRTPKAGRDVEKKFWTAFWTIKIIITAIIFILLFIFVRRFAMLIRG